MNFLHGVALAGPAQRLLPHGQKEISFSSELGCPGFITLHGRWDAAEVSVPGGPLRAEPGGSLGHT